MSLEEEARTGMGIGIDGCEMVGKGESERKRDGVERSGGGSGGASWPPPAFNVGGGICNCWS